MDEITVYRDRGAIDESEVYTFEKQIGFSLPKNYISLITKHNGLQPENCIFDYQLNSKQYDGDINFFAFGNGLKSFESIIHAQTNEGVPGFFVIFGYTAGGDFVGFSFSSKQCKEPVIAILLHDVFDEDGTMKKVEVAQNFEAFISNLHEEHK